MKFAQKMWFMMILKVTKTQGFALSLENTFLKQFLTAASSENPMPLTLSDIEDFMIEQ